MRTSPTPRELLRRLVAFDTVSAHSNLDLIEFVADHLDRHGLATELTYDDQRRKANLFATVGPADRAGIVLSGHTDVVPVEGQAWSSDPFVLAERDGRLHGRGTADMKGFLATCLALVPKLDPKTLAEPVHLALSYDEEVGCLGAPRLIAALERADRPKPRLVVVGEPTDLTAVGTHKGIRTLATTVTGRAAHSSLPDAGASAVTIAAELVGFLAQVARELRQRPQPASGFDPPCTTLNVGRIEGGIAVNIIAERCRFAWEYRSLPDEDPDEVLDRLEDYVATTLLPRERARWAEVAVATELLASVPALESESGSAAERLVRESLGPRGSDPPGAVSFVTEAGLFQRAGIPAIVCGPGDIVQAHRSDEHITLASLDAGERFVRDLLARATAR